VYLLHMFVRHGAAAVLDRVAVRVPGDLFVAVVLGTWLAAEVSFHLFESRFLALKKRFARVAASATSGHAASP
jgi:peptidoglycan/LPS O-acetylase OafA/YrhL